jgi:hypothetical protein
VHVQELLGHAGLQLPGMRLGPLWHFAVAELLQACKGKGRKRTNTLACMRPCWDSLGQLINLPQLPASPKGHSQYRH